jgi:hypothetical protein
MSKTEVVLEHEFCTTDLRRLRRAEIDRLWNLPEPRRLRTSIYCEKSN